MNEKLEKVKNKIREHRFEIIVIAAHAAVFTTYIVLSEIDRKKYVRLPKGETSVLELPHESVRLMMEEDVHPWYDFLGHNIQVVYNPETK